MHEAGRRLRQYAIIAGIQGVCTIAASPAIALESGWQAYYAQGQEALERQKPAEAEQFFRKALTLAQGNSAGSEKCLMELADTLVLRNKTSEAQSLYQRLLDLAVKKYGNESRRIAPILMSLGSIQESLGNHGAAVMYYQRALKINQKNYGPYSPAFAENLHALGRANCRAGKKQEAAKQYKQAISILMKEPGLQASERLQSLLSDYTDLLTQDEDTDKNLIKDFKEDVLRQNPDSKSMMDSGTGSILPESAGANPDGSGFAQLSMPKAQMHGSPAASDQSSWQKQNNIQLKTSAQAQLNEDPQLALRGLEQPWSTRTLSPAYKIVDDALVKQNRYEQGEPEYQRMIAADLDALGPHHPSVANDLSGLAQLYIRQQNYAQAEPLLARAYVIYREAYGMDNLLSINTCASLALVEFHLGRTERAAELYRDALSHCQAALGPNDFQTASVLNELAYLYFQQGKLQEARTLYKWALASTEAALGGQSPMLAACLKDYALVLRGLGQSSQAADLESRADNILAGAK